MSNHSLPARGTDPPLSHKSVGSITHEQNIICSETLICRYQVICRSRVELSVNEKEEKNTSNDNNNSKCVMLIREILRSRCSALPVQLSHQLVGRLIQR